VVEPLVSVITDISLDHQKYLGDTVAEIAREKAGIIRPDAIVVTLPQQPQANDVIGNTILELGAHAVSAAPYVPPVTPASDQYWLSGNDHRRGTASRYALPVMGKQIQVETPLVGRHQLRNVALAIAAAEELSKQGFAITADSIERGIRETHWPGRFQIVPANDAMPECVFDAAHNPAGAWALRSALSSVYEGRRLTFVFGAMRDKAIAEIAEILFPLAEHVIATHAENPRSATPQEIREAAARVSVEMEDAPDVPSALERARILAGREGLVVITGSMYVVGEAMQALKIRI
jgi:dihydrofolate synthase/folylpolyglutamate synthase